MIMMRKAMMRTLVREFLMEMSWKLILVMMMMMMMIAMIMIIIMMMNLTPESFMAILRDMMMLMIMIIIMRMSNPVIYFMMSKNILKESVIIAVNQANARWLHTKLSI